MVHVRRGTVAKATLSPIIHHWKLQIRGSAIYSVVSSEMEVTDSVMAEESTLLINSRPDLSPCTRRDGSPTGLKASTRGAVGYLVRRCFMGPVTEMWRSV